MKITQTIRQLETIGIKAPNRIYWQLNTPQLYEEAVQRHEGYVAHLGPLVVRTGNNTSLTHKDRYIVAEPATQSSISWGEVNRPYDSDRFDALLKRMGAYFQGMDIFVQDAYVRTGATSRMPLRVVTETAWHNLFVRNNYLPSGSAEPENFHPEFTILHAPGFRAIPERDHTNSDVFVIIHLMRKIVLIGGTGYVGEIPKAIFSVLNYELSRRNILTMECAVNVGKRDDVALFVGIDGAGKTTLAFNSDRTLIGDTEHGWDKDGVFSFGRGCYVRMLDRTRQDSPEIWQTTRRFGTLLENVAIDVKTRRLNLTEGTFTENTRASYPISHIPGASREGVADHPQNLFLLVKDTFGVLPPVSILTPQQAHFYYLTGYTGDMIPGAHGKFTPQAKFSTCYGAPFMPLHPGHYAQLFQHRIEEHDVKVWMLNTGWVGDPTRRATRIPLEISRNIVHAALSGELAQSDTYVENYFGLTIPATCPGVPDDMLDPVKYWQDEDAYAEMAQKLIKLLDKHGDQYQNEVDPTILNVQPEIG